MNVPPRVRAVLIGISGYGRIHLGLARGAQSRGLDLVAAVVINRDEEVVEVDRLQRQGCRIYADYESMLRAEQGRAELCLIPTGIAWHERMTVAALAAGMSVLVEKPLAASLREIQSIAAAERAAPGCFVAVGFQDLYNPEVHVLKRRLREGMIGRIERVRFLGLWPRSTSYFRRNHWAGRLAADGAPVLDSVLSNAFAHFVNLALFLAGPETDSAAVPEEIEAVLWRTNAIETFDTGVIRAVSPEGVRFWFGASHACASTHEPEIVLEGTAGSLTWLHEREWRLETQTGARERCALPGAPANRAAMMDAVLRRFADPTVFVCGPALAQGHTTLIERAHAMARIHPAPGGVESRLLPGVEGTVLVAPAAERALRHAFAAGGLPDAGAVDAIFSDSSHL
jgi:predicted dehydrogenase